MSKWKRHFYTPVLPLEEKRVTGSKEHIELSKQAARECMVLLKNEYSILPLKERKIVLLGKAIVDYVKGGGGSGDVYCEYITNIYQAFCKKEKEGKLQFYHALCDFYDTYVKDEYAKGNRAGMIEEPLLEDTEVRKAAEFASVAILCLSRFSGENWDRLALSNEDDFVKVENIAIQSKELYGISDFYLSINERRLVQQACNNFESVIVVINSGGVIDTKWIKDTPNIKGAVVASQLGMEGGTAIADLLCGDIYPSGKLVDTYADDLFSYPCISSFHKDINSVEYNEDIFVGYRYFNTFESANAKVVYPFGYGLSYTTFSFSDLSIKHIEAQCYEVRVTVTNTGSSSGKEVAELYCEAPRGILDKPSLILVGFKKTKELKSGERELLTISLDLSNLASYDDEGLIAKNAYVLEKGIYKFYIGSSIDRLEKTVLTVSVNADILRQVETKLSPSRLTTRLNRNGEYVINTTNKQKNELVSGIGRQDINTLEGVIPVGHIDRNTTRADVRASMDKWFINVAEDKMSMDDFISLLSIDDMIDLVGGQPNTGVANTYGFGNLPLFGIPNVMTADGPAGLRILPECEVNTTAWPCATALAQSWNPDLVESIGYAAGKEVKENNIGFWLTPGVNIHRNPVCGRNFEYYSEDPFVAGIMGSAMVVGIQRNHIGACVKHFALNNKESNRKECDSIVSEKAIREIYIKPFEMIVKNANPYAIMSSYNIINGVRAAENKELLSDILRDEWGFDGIVFSDWWNHSEHYLELLAGEDVKMGNGYCERVREAFDKNLITRKDLENNVRHILSTILKLD